MGTIRIGKIDLDKRFLYAGIAVLAVLLIAAAAWFFGTERLPGHNIDPVLKPEYIEPNGQTTEYFTGHVISTEISILGPKMDVKLDSNNSERAFYVPERAPVWLGLVIEDKDITGQERITFQDLRKGWRVAVFVGPQNRARRINVLKRVDSEK